MKIVIELPDDEYEAIIYSGGSIDDRQVALVVEAIDVGTPLPKGHGRLIDANKASEVMMDAMCGTGYQSMAMRVVESEFYTPTIIEADKEVDE